MEPIHIKSKKSNFLLLENHIVEEENIIFSYVALRKDIKRALLDINNGYPSVVKLGGVLKIKNLEDADLYWKGLVFLSKKVLSIGCQDFRRRNQADLQPGSQDKGELGMTDHSQITKLESALGFRVEQF